MVLGHVQVPELDGPAHTGPKTLEAKRAVRWVRAPTEEQLAEWQIEKRSLQKTIRSQAVRLAEMKRELDVQSVKLSMATESMARAQEWPTPTSSAARSTPRVDVEAELQRSLDEQASRLRDAQSQLAAMTEALGARAQDQLDRAVELRDTQGQLAAATAALGARAQDQLDRAVERGVAEKEAATLRARIAELEGELSASNSRLDQLTLRGNALLTAGVACAALVLVIARARSRG